MPEAPHGSAAQTVAERPSQGGGSEMTLAAGVGQPVLIRDGADLDQLLADQQAFFETGATRPYAFRAEQLRRLKEMLAQNEERILEALYQDLRKPPVEAYSSEIGFCYAEINHALKHLKGWMKPRRVSTPLAAMPAASYVYPEPRGRVLIIAPWNYPVQLLVVPLIGAIAAGNVAILKPSELAPHTSALMADLIGRYFPREFVAVVEGGVDVSQALLAKRFDYIFFTGGERVGKIVARAAAEHLTPVTLELGGKSPCIVTADADLDLAARRIVWGKFYNAGQTCVAPDYLLVDRRCKAELLDRMKQYLHRFYGAQPAASPDFARIISDRHFLRLEAMLQNATIVAGGVTDRASRYIAPTILDDVGLDHPSMQEEIFGPILPVLTFDTLDEAMAIVRRMPHPLALYLFSRDESVQERITRELSFGGGCINDTLLHLSNPNLPFGGIGSSGYGAYHGKYSFDTFSHHKAVVKSMPVIDPPIRYQPYAGKLKWIKQILR
jgi:aldehyde dehydrogenase (NAD+)